jgi:hypothetical protein
MTEIAERILGYCGDMLSHSKSGYRDKNPNNLVVFNANVCVDNQKIWYGDIDVTKSKDELIQLASELKQAVYVLSEMDGRFENENRPKIDKFMAKFEPDGECVLNERIKSYYTI